MKYEVVWGPRTEGMLATAWIAATGRNAVTIVRANGGGIKSSTIFNQA